MNRASNLFRATLLFYLTFTFLFGQANENGVVRGTLPLDKSWKPSIYLSFIPNFDEMYSISNEMIIAETDIDSLGNFEFDISFLPEETKLFRLHIVKNGDSKSSLIIGGIDENHLFLIANRNSFIDIQTELGSSPFRNTIFKKASQNAAFYRITNLIHRRDSIVSTSGASKRKFLDDQLNEELLSIVDTSSNLLLSLYALSSIGFNSIETSFFDTFLDKWDQENNAYLESFREKFPKRKENRSYLIFVFLAFLFILFGYLLGTLRIRKSNRLKKLSIQERKIFSLLKEGATNQEIADSCSIGMSTVKSHVSSILSKLNAKSRKEIIDF